jgi:hypothetical protein
MRPKLFEHMKISVITLTHNIDLNNVSTIINVSINDNGDEDIYRSEETRTSSDELPLSFCSLKHRSSFTSLHAGRICDIYF